MSPRRLKHPTSNAALLPLVTALLLMLLAAALVQPLLSAAHAAAKAGAPAPAAVRPTSVRDAATLPSLSSFGRVGPGPTLDQTVAQTDTFLTVSHGFQELNGACAPRGWAGEDLTTRLYAHVSDQFVVNRPFAGGYPEASALTVFTAPLAGTRIAQTGPVALNDSGRVVFWDIGCLPPCDRQLYEVVPEANLLRQFATDGGGVRPRTVASDPLTGGIFIGDAAASTVMYLAPGASTATVFANVQQGIGTGADTTLNHAEISPYAMSLDNAGNIYYTEASGNRFRMIRRNDLRVITLETGFNGGAMAVNPDGSEAFYVASSDSRIHRLDLVTHANTVLTGPADNATIAQSGYMAWSAGSIYLSAYGVFNYSRPAAVFKLVGGALQRVAGATTFYGSAATANSGLQAPLSDVGGMCADQSGGIYFTSGGLVLRLRSDGNLELVAGDPVSVQMGQRALRVGADMTTAPDEVANWLSPRGYGNGWSQRIVSPSVDVSAHPNAVLSFDMASELGLTGNTIETIEAWNPQTIAEYVLVQYQRADGTWGVLQPTIAMPMVASVTQSAFRSPTGTFHYEVHLAGNGSLPTPTRFRVVVQSSMSQSNEDSPLPAGGGGGAAIIDNLRLRDGATNLLPFEDFEDGTLDGGWTLEALNGAYDDASNVGSILRDVPFPGTQAQLLSGFDFTDPSCVWTFTSPGDSVPAGLHARVTSPWIARNNRTAQMLLAFSGKLNTQTQGRVLDFRVRGKNAGDSRPTSYFFPAFLLNSGTNGGDIGSPFIHERVMSFPNDFTRSLAGGPFDCDSIQIVLGAQDRREQLTPVFGPQVNSTHLPYLDDILVLERSVDADFDGVADAHDLCPSECAAGQDANGDGCIDATATFHHVETWPAGQIIRYAYTAGGNSRVAGAFTALDSAFAAWSQVPGASVPLMKLLPTTTRNGTPLDGLNIVSFEDVTFPFSPEVLAVTTTLELTRRTAYGDQVMLPGTVVDKDILFNPDASFSTPSQAGAFDLRSVATHEVGHLLGLDHSGVREATMYFVQLPGTEGASLDPDDQAAIAAAYPAASLATDFGTIRGTVVRDTLGVPVGGALVTAVLVAGGGVAADTVASDFTDEQGRFALFRLAPGAYNVHVQALDGTVLDGMDASFVSARLASVTGIPFEPEWYNAAESAFDDRDLRDPVTVSAGATVAGLTVITNLDTIPPGVVSVSPPAGSSGIGIDAAIQITFSDPIDPGTLNAAFGLFPALTPNNRLAGNALVADRGRRVVFTPNDPLVFASGYEVRITSALTDQAGNPLAADFSSSFTTQAQPPVSITNIQPRAVSPGALVTITGTGFNTGQYGYNKAVFKQPVLPAASTDSVTGTFVTPTTMVVRVPSNEEPGPDSVHVVVDDINFISSPEVSNVFAITILPPAEQPSPSISGSPVAVGFAPDDVVLAPNGSMAYVVGDGGFATVNLSSPSGGPLRTAVFRDTRPAHAIALSPDGRRAFVTHPADSAVVVFDADPGSGTFGAQTASVPLVGRPGPIAVAPTGQRAYAGDLANGFIHEIDIKPGSLTENVQLRAIAYAHGAINGLAVSFDNSLLIVASTGGTYFVSFLDLSAGIQSPLTDNGGVAASPTGGLDLFAVGADGVARPDVGSTFVGGYVKDVIFTPQGQAAYLVNQSLNRLQVFNNDLTHSSYNTVVADVGTGNSPVAAAVDAGGGLLVVANHGSRDLTIYQVTQSGVPLLARVIPDMAIAGDLVAAQSSSDSTSFGNALVDLGTGPTFPATLSIGRNAAFRVPQGLARETQLVLEWPGPVRTLGLPFTVLDPVQTFVPTGTWSIPEEDTVCGFTVGGNLGVLRMSPDGRSLAVVRTTNCLFTLDIYDVATDGSRPFAGIAAKHLLGAVPIGAALLDGAFTPDGRQFWALPNTGGIRATDVDPASPTYGVTSAFGSVSQQVLLADPLGRFMLSGASFGAGSLTFWNWATDSVVQLLPAVLPASMAASGDGHYLVAGQTTNATFVDLNSRTVITSSPAHGPAAPDSAFISVQVTGDGRRAMGVWGRRSAGEQRRIAVWNLDPDAGPIGQELYFGIPAGMFGIAPNELVPGPDGHSVIAAGHFTNHLLSFDLSVIPPVLTVQPAGHPAITTAGLARSTDGRQLWMAEPGNAGNTATDGVIHLYMLDEAASIELVAGEGQSGFGGATLPLPVVLRVRTADGGPAQGALLNLSLATGNGTINGAQAVVLGTDVNGEVQVPWTLPLSAGDVQMSISGFGFTVPPVVVTAHVVLDDASVLPQVVSLSPVTGTLGLNVQTPVAVRFNQRMTPAVTQSITLLANGQAVPGGFELVDEGRFVVFRPAEPLPFSASCELTVAAGALDLDGQALAAGASSAFTIQSPPTIHVDAIVPPAGPPGAAVTLSGEGFSPLASQNTVIFNGTLGTVGTATTTGVTLDVPVVATSGPVTVTAGGQTSDGFNFIVLPPNADPGGVIGDLPAGQGSRDIALTPDGARAYITNPPLNTVTVLDLVAVQTLASITVGLRPVSIAMLASPLRAYVANNVSNSVSVIDADPASEHYNEVVETIPVGRGPVDVTVWPAGQQVFVLNAAASNISVIDGNPHNATNDQVVTTVNCGSGGTQVVISADGSTAYVAVAAGLQIIDIATDHVVTTVNCGSAATNVVITADGTLAFVLTSDGHLVVVALTGPNANQVVGTTNCGSATTSVVITADGTLAFVTTTDGNVLVFRIGAGAGGNTSSQAPGPPVVLTPVETFALGGTPAGVAPDPLGRIRAWVTNSATGRLHVIGTPDALPHVEVGFDVSPNTLNLRSLGHWVTGTITPPEPFLAESIHVASIRLNGTVAVDPEAPVGVQDGALVVRFSRAALQLILPTGDHVEVCVTGTIGPRLFSGCDTIKVKHGVVTHPVANAVLQPGAAAEVRWEAPHNTQIEWVAILHSFDHGTTWTVDADHEPNDGVYSWNVPLVAKDSVRVAVVFVEQDTIPEELRPADWTPDHVVAVVAMSDPFSIFGATDVALVAPRELSFALTGPNPARGEAGMRFGLPARADVKLELFDVAGRRVKTLAKGTHAAGWHSVRWNGTGDSGTPIGAGLYFVRFRAEGREFGTRLVWLK